MTMVYEIYSQSALLIKSGFFYKCYLSTSTSSEQSAIHKSQGLSYPCSSRWIPDTINRSVDLPPVRVAVEAENQPCSRGEESNSHSRVRSRHCERSDDPFHKM